MASGKVGIGINIREMTSDEFTYSGITKSFNFRDADFAKKVIGIFGFSTGGYLNAGVRIGDGSYGVRFSQEGEIVTNFPAKVYVLYFS